jgi:hypothetical protein
MVPFKRVPRLAVLVAFSLAASGTMAYPATVRYQSDAELIGGSARVVRARVVASRGERGPRGRIYTVTTVDVLEDFSGYGDSTLEIRELGGTVDDEFLFVGGGVQYQPGSEIVVCLGRVADGSLRSLAMGFSKFDVIRTTADDPILRRNLSETMVVGGPSDGAPRRLGAFRELAERVRGLRSVVPPGARSLPATSDWTAESFTLLDFGNGRGGRWTEADSGTPVNWYLDASAPPPVPGNGFPELETALAGWTSPPQASIVLANGGYTDQTPSGGPWTFLGAPGVVFFEDPENDIETSSGVLALGGGWGSTQDEGGIVNGRPFKRFLSGFVIFQNAAQLPSNFHQTRDFSRVLMHEIGHGIGLGHSDAGAANIMHFSCCGTSTPVAPAIGPDDLAGLSFIYPTASQCTYSLSSNSVVASAAGGSVLVTVSTQAGCSWTVTGTPPWISTSVGGGTGNGSVQLTIAPNPVANQRAATLSIGGRPLAVSQDPCPCTVTPTSVSIGARGGAIAISVSSSGCQWSASSQVPWIAVTDGTSGTGSGPVTLSVTRNTGTARTAFVAVAGRLVTVTQGDGTQSVVADFNGDGQSDLVWHHQLDGRMSVWQMNGLTLVSGTLLTPDRVSDTNWKIVGVWDPNGDGNPDLLWRHQTSGALATWRMNGTTMVSGDPLSPGAVPDTGWEIVATADLDRDGNTDLVWQHATQGLVSAWLMNGTSLVEGRLLSPSTVADTDWRIVGSGDFDGDGHADFVWQHRTSGQASIWFMNGTTLVRGTLLAPPGVADTSWQIRAVVDMNGDGQPDLVWQNVMTGYLAAWLMNGPTMVEGIYLSPNRVADTGWRVSGPR